MNGFLWRRAVLVRVLPLAVFMLLLALRGQAEGGAFGIDARWLYAWQVALVAAVLAWGWRNYGELARQMRPTVREAAWAALVGLLVFVAWIHLDAGWMTLGPPSATFVPLQANGQLDQSLLLVRVLGAVLVVPLMEELFWRSFLMRWVDDAQFERVVPHQLSGKAVVLSTFVFVLAHTQWLAAAIAGLAYALLYRRSGKLWLAIMAHAVTNAALALWVVQGRHWQFW